MYDKLKALAEKQELTKSDKSFIVKCCEELNLVFNPKAGCRNCYFDQIFTLTAILNANKQNEGCDYMLNPKFKIDMIHRGVRINADTLDNKKAEMLIKDGLQKWFSTLPNNDNK